MPAQRHPPGPKERFPLSNLFAFRKDILGFLKKLAVEHGDVAQFRIGPIRVVLLNHPDYIKDVLTVNHKKFVKGRPLEMAKELLGEGILTSEGEYHKQHARVIQPAFHRKKIESYVPAITDCIDRATKTWRDGEALELRQEMTKMSTMIAGQVMFSEDVERESSAIVHALDTATGLFGRIPVPFSEYFLRLPLPDNIRFFRAKSRLDRLIYRLIDNRRRLRDKPDDLLSMLMNPHPGENGDGGLTDEQIRDEALTLFLTAFDTTSIALTWTWYLLSQNPAVEAEFHRELDRVLAGRTANASDIPQLKFTRMVLTEAMRIFPPTHVIPRQAIEDFSVNGYDIPRGSLVLMSPYLIHHDSRFHSDPEIFNPHAWREKETNNISRFEYFPFSGGPRMCIGEPFAWIEGVLVLATLGQSWRMRLVPGHPVEMLPLINLRPKHGMKMTIHKRVHD